MSETPVLSRHDVEEALKTRYPADTLIRGKERRKLVAYYGTGAPDHVDVQPVGRFQIVPVESELDLRERLVSVGAEDCVAFLVPWFGDLPLDVAGRFSGTRVQRIGADARLRVLFGAKEVDGELRGSALARYLLRRAGSGQSYSSGGGRLTRQVLFEAWLGKDLGIDVQGGLGLDLFIAWAATDARGPQWATALTSDGAEGVRDETLAYLEQRLGPAGPVVWKLWESERGRTALEFALIAEPLVVTSDPAVRMWLGLKAREELRCSESEVTPTLESLAKAAPTALRTLERRDPKEAKAVLLAADAREIEKEVRPFLAGSSRLLCAWGMRQDQLGQVLLEAAKEPTRAAVEKARSALSELERHLLFRDANKASEVKRAEMALRLLSWLADWRVRPVAASGMPPQRDAEELGRWYADQGGYVDWARRVARGGRESTFGRGVQAVVEAADAVRHELDARFSRSLVRWVESGRPPDHVVGIEQALKRVAVKFLEGHAERSLLVLLLDGMAWAQAAELLESLGAREWGPLTWHSSREGSAVGAPYPVVFAGLPTVTEVSRAEFFAGKLLSAGEARNTTKDPERFAAHRDLKKFVPENELPRLLLRSEGHAQDGSASEEALSLVRDTRRRIVSIVVNAIDDSLKSSTQDYKEWTVGAIRSLAALLDAARDAGRSVLIASDHGHVPGARLNHVGTFPGAGARHRPWLEGDIPGEHELGFAGTGVATPKGAKGVILLTDEVSRYGSAPHAGEHGGATLAEVIAPCFLIGTDEPGSARHDADKALVPKPARQPDWWQFEVWSEHEPSASVSEKPKGKPKPRASDKQILLPNLDVTPPAPLPPPRKPTPKPGTLSAAVLESPFAKSEILASRAPRAELRKQVIAAVHYLLERNGVATGEAFAAALETLPYRVGGLISNLQEVLNIDGYAVLSYDPSTRTVTLDRDKLNQQFEIRS